jgi:hypothetical protein
MNTFSTIAKIDNVLDLAGDAPTQYAGELVRLVGEGYAVSLPMSVKGKPTSEVKAIKDQIVMAYREQGVSAGAGMRKRVLRLTYALHILSANPQGEGETPEAFVTRVSRMRAIANGCDLATIEKAIKGATPRKARPDKKDKPASKPADKNADKPAVKPADKVLTPNQIYVEAHNALIVAMTTYQNAVADHIKAGGTLSKASVTQVTLRATNILKTLSA